MKETAMSWVKNVRGTEVAIFRQTAGKFSTKEIWVLTFLLLSLNFLNMQDFEPQI